MLLSNYRDRGCAGCSGRKGGNRIAQVGEGCAPVMGEPNPCGILGPFRAVDAACLPIVPPAAATGSIIPFSSGITDVVLTSLAGGLVGTTSLVGFGTAVPGVTLLGNTIDTTALLTTEAFSVPRAGNITSISASLRILAAVTLLGTVTVHATVFRAPAGSNTFTATAATVDLTPTLTGLIAIGDLVSGTTTVPPVPVAAGDRLLMVYSITATGLGDLAATVTGAASAGITIE